MLNFKKITIHYFSLALTLAATEEIALALDCGPQTISGVMIDKDSGKVLAKVNWVGGKPHDHYICLPQDPGCSHMYSLLMSAFLKGSLVSATYDDEEVLSCQNPSGQYPKTIQIHN